MIVDCDRCVVRGDACGDCVITVLLGAPPGGVRLDATERRALDALAGAGLVPQLRLVPANGAPAAGARTVGSQTGGGEAAGARGAGCQASGSGAAGIAGWAVKRGERSNREAG